MIKKCQWCKKDFKTSVKTALTCSKSCSGFRMGKVRAGRVKANKARKNDFPVSDDVAFKNKFIFRIAA